MVLRKHIPERSVTKGGGFLLKCLHPGRTERLSNSCGDRSKGPCEMGRARQSEKKGCPKTKMIECKQFRRKEVVHVVVGTLAGTISENWQAWLDFGPLSRMLTT